MMKYLMIFTVVIIAGSALNACGIKPNRIDPPSGVEDKAFPSSYPKNVSK